MRTLPVDFLALFMSHFRNLAGKLNGRDQGFKATIMKSSVDEVREKVSLSIFFNFNNGKVKRRYKIIYLFTFSSVHDVLFKGLTSRLSLICKQKAEDFFQRCLALATMT